jgi:hypothetical protein
MSDAYYGANTGALLYMGTSTATPLPAPGSDTFTEVPLVGSITPPPNEQSTGFFNVLNDANRRSVGGKLNDRLVEGDLVIDWTESVHVAMHNDSLAEQKRNWRIVYPDSGGRQLDFVGFVSKWAEEAFSASDEAKEHRASYTITVDGAITVTA